MNILNPNDTIHTLKVIPRYYPTGDITLELTPENYSSGFTVAGMPEIIDGYMYITFEREFTNATDWRVKISEGEEIVYRGKVFVTDQSGDTQAYSTTKDIFVL